MECRTLEITLQCAKDLNKVNLISKMDVYVIVSISGGDNNSKQQTKTPVDRDGNANPTWNFSMKLTVEEVALQQNRLTLDFKLVCERALGDRDIGEVHVPIKELLDSAASGGAAAEGKQFVTYQVRKPNGKPRGQVTFTYQFGEKTAASPPTPLVTGKYDSEPVMAYPVTGPSSAYPPPQGGYSQPYGAAEVAGGPYPPPAGYPSAGGAPTQGAYLIPGYGYPSPPPGYGYPPPPSGYGYPPAVQQPAKKNKFGLGRLGAGFLGGAIGGLLVGDMISDAADFDCGGGFDF